MKLLDWVLNLVLCLGEYRPLHPRLVARLAQQRYIMHLLRCGALDFQVPTVGFGGYAGNPSTTSFPKRF